MKKILIMLAVGLTVAACGGKKEKENNEEAQAAPQEQMWETVDPTELESFNPFQTIGKDWMALAMGNKDSMNSMTISWGSTGVLWNKNTFTVYVSSDRYSKHLMDAAKYFTVMAFPESSKNKEALSYIGSVSQRDEPDKTKNAGFTTRFTELGNPIFDEADLCFECKIIYKEELKKELMPADVKPRYDEMGLHTMYIGEIVNVFRKK